MKITDDLTGLAIAVTAANLKEKKMKTDKKEVVCAWDNCDSKIETPKPILPITPVADMVLVEMIIKDKTEGGISLPSSAQEAKSGFLRAIGKGVDQKYLNNGIAVADGLSQGLKLGDRVFLPRGMNSGQIFEEKYLLAPVTAITAIINK